MEPAANPEIDAPVASPTIAPRVAPAPRRILIKAVNWLGDVVMTLPAIIPFSSVATWKKRSVRRSDGRKPARMPSSGDLWEAI